MSPEEAIIEIDNEIARQQFSMWNSVGDREKPNSKEIIAFKIAIEALNKQIAKKAINITITPSYIQGTCPNCNTLRLKNTMTIFCPNCGQKIDWEY